MYIATVIGLVHSKGEYTICDIHRNERLQWLWVYEKRGLYLIIELFYSIPYFKKQHSRLQISPTHKGDEG